MKFSVLLLVSLLVFCNSVALAGGFVDVRHTSRKIPVERVLPPDTAMPSPPIERTIERVVEKAPAKPAPAQGLALGFHGNYPTVTFVGTDLEIEAGYTSRFSDASAVLRGAGVAWASEDRYTLIKAGLAVFPGNGPAWGVYGELEQFLTPTVSISGALYPIKSGNGQTIWGDAIVSGRVYL